VPKLALGRLQSEEAEGPPPAAAAVARAAAGSASAPADADGASPLRSLRSLPLARPPVPALPLSKLNPAASMPAARGATTRIPAANFSALDASLRRSPTKLSSAAPSPLPSAQFSGVFELLAARLEHRSSWPQRRSPCLLHASLPCLPAYDHPQKPSCLGPVPGVTFPLFPLQAPPSPPPTLWTSWTPCWSPPAPPPPPPLPGGPSPPASPGCWRRCAPRGRAAAAWTGRRSCPRGGWARLAPGPKTAVRGGCLAIAGQPGDPAQDGCGCPALRLSCACPVSRAMQQPQHQSIINCLA
jgi:hypothetical protein